MNFNNPPINEVVLGVQYATPSSFRSTDFARVYALYKDEYPLVTDLPRLAPAFEMFGGNPSPGFQFQFGPAIPLQNRVWFSSADENHLLQFQDDRFFLNWRKRRNEDVYPRFEFMLSSFSDALKRLSSFFENELGEPLMLNQAEVSYINIIPVESWADTQEWLKLLNGTGLQPEGINIILNEVMIRSDRSLARMHYEVQSATDATTGLPVVRFGLTYRGDPGSHSVDAALSFVADGREKIVAKFCDLTTDRAHAAWERLT